MGQLHAQEIPQYEDILESFETEENTQIDFLEILQHLEDNPINVNSATIRELLRIPFLNQQLAREIVHHRNRNGGYKNETDLLNVEGLSEELLSAISPLIVFKPIRRNPVVDYRVQLGRPLHTIRGYDEPPDRNHYKNPYYLYHRLRWNPGPDIRAGFIWENGSFFLTYHWRKAKSHVLVGDFNLEVGQRLLFSNPYGFPLSIGTTYPFTQTPFRWRPKSAVDENAFLRGVLWDFAPFESSVFTVSYSRHDIDANLSDDSSFVRSIYSSGYHRTATEESKKKRLSEEIISGGFFKDFITEQAGIQISRTSYSLPISIDDETGRQNFTYLSGYYSSTRGLLKLQGEAVLLNGKFPAIQQTLLVKSPNPRMFYSALVYYHHPNYWSFHGRSFGKTSASPSNELGYFLSVSAHIFPTTEIAAYFHAARPVRSFDDFTFLKRSQQFRVIQKLNNSRILLRYTRRIRKGAVAAPTQKFSISEQQTDILRFHIETKLSKQLLLTHRVEASWFNPPAEAGKRHGISFYQDFRYRPAQSLSMQFRWTQFEIPDYDYRLYEFENDLPGNFRNVLLNSRGFKWFFLISYKFVSKWNVALKYRETHYPDEVILGSGLDTVLGNRRREVRAQLQIIF
jgi:hypothetical protein